MKRRLKRGCSGTIINSAFQSSTPPAGPPALILTNFWQGNRQTMSESVSYDIHEKIAQLETELLQHELLIRRQKHVITSLKNMINNPANQGLIGSPSATHVPVSTTAPVYVAASNPSTARKTISLPIRTTSAVVAAAPQTNLSVSSSSAKKSSSSTDVTINLEKKRTAIDMVSLNFMCTARMHK